MSLKSDLRRIRTKESVRHCDSLRRGRRLYMLQMLVLAFVPHAALIMQNCTIMAQLSNTLAWSLYLDSEVSCPTHSQLSNTLAWSLYLDSEVSSGLYAGDTVVSLQEERLMLSKHLFTTSLQPAMSRRNNTSHLHLAFLWSDRNMSLLPPPAVPPHPRQAL
ncbi:hypothetical protein JYU34_005618 [Plutella xylostella]|uniref:Uncharacterized protein n=1 Tax=Plutella xylostella TaxID=51655 RepID=A0ABQ7QTP5_PLUXY|nr:hypothetical protein JYU34_005618 [Plutella xylostella]